MISIGKVRDAGYYLAEVEEDDHAGYYLDDPAPSRWLGRLAAAHGLVGEVDPDAFRLLLAGQRPDGTPLTVHSTSTRAIDVTLSVPKSVSVFWACADAEEKRQVVSALDEAAAAVVELLELEATKVRRGHGGIEVLAGNGLLVAGFDHRTSRLGDPNLHRHLVVANATVGPDGRTTALDTRQLYRIRYTAEAVFQAVLRHELSHRLGLVFGPADRHGAAEISGIPTHVRRAFSRRRREIESEMIWQGITTGRGARIAALATRPAKDRTLNEDVLVQRWRAEATELGLRLDRMPRQAPTVAVDAPDIPAVARAVTEHDATFTRWDALRTVSRLPLSGAPLHQLLQRTEEFLAADCTVGLGSGRYTTTEILELERRAVASAVQGRGTGTGLLTSETVAAALAARPRLAPEQRRLVQSIAHSGDTVSVVIGQAGAGKTTALDALHDAYRRAGYTVVGAALSARAAAELHAGTGIPSHTLHRIETVLSRNRHALDARTVLVVDEAAMVGSRQLAALIDATERAGNKLVLVGDTGQLPEINAGGTFAAIARRVTPATLTENRRQRRLEHRVALAALRHADVATALANLKRIGDLTTAADADTLRTALVADWLQTRNDGERSVMLAANRADVADLNRRAIDQLALADQLGPVVWRSGDLTLHEGDEVFAHRNRHDLDLLNGDRGVVHNAGRDEVTVELERGGTVRVPSTYIDAGHLTHGYAVTVHKAQGMTCDHAFFLGDDGLFNELGYTGLSRGRYTNHLYAVAARTRNRCLCPRPLRRGSGISLDQPSQDRRHRSRHPRPAMTHPPANLGHRPAPGHTVGERRQARDRPTVVHQRFGAAPSASTTARG